MLSRHTRLQELEPAQSQLLEPSSVYRKITTQQPREGSQEEQDDLLNNNGLEKYFNVVRQQRKHIL